MLEISSKPLPTLNSCQHSEALPSWHQELRCGVGKCAFEFARNNSDYQFFPVFSRGAGRRRAVSRSPSVALHCSGHRH